MPYRRSFSPGLYYKPGSKSPNGPGREDGIAPRRTNRDQCFTLVAARFKTETIAPRDAEQKVCSQINPDATECILHGTM
jgi:hypothetical protein